MNGAYLVLPAIVLLLALCPSAAQCRAGEGSPAEAEGDARPRVSGTLPLAECYKWLEQRNKEYKSALIRLRMAEMDLQKAANDFDPTLTMSYSSSDTEFGGSSVDATIFGTHRQQDVTELSLGSLTKQGGTVTLNYTRRRSETNSSFGAPVTYYGELGLNFEQPLFKGAGRVSALFAYRTARLAYLQAKENTAATLAGLRKTMVMHFYDCLRKQLEVMENEASVKRNNILCDTSKAKFEAGLATRLEVLESRLRLREAEAALIRVRGELEIAMNELARDLDVRFAPDVKIEHPLSFAPRHPEFEERYAEACRRRHDLQAARIALQLARETYEYKRNADKPDIRLSASYSRNSQGPESDDAGRFDNRSYSVMLVYTTPLGKRDERIDLDSAAAAVEDARLQLENLQERIVLEVKNSIRSLMDAEEAVKVNDDQRKLAREKFDFYKTAYENGIKTWMDVLEAEQILTQKENAYTASLVDYLKAKVSCLESSGSDLTYEEVAAY